MSDEQIQVEQVPATEATPGASPEPAKQETLDQTMERVYREIQSREPSRGEGGRFQPKVVAQGAPEGGVEVPGSPEAAPPDPAPPVIEAPQSLPDDVKKVWSTLPLAHQQWLATREGEIHKKLTADGERLKSFEAYDAALADSREFIEQNRIPKAEYIRRLAAADQMLRTNGPAALAEIARMYGINPGAAFNPGTQPAPHLTESDIQTRISRGVEEKFQQIHVQEAAKQIEAFRTGLPADEQGDFDRLEADMIGLRQAHPKWTLEQLYKAARRADPDTLAKDEAKAKAAADAKAVEDARKKQEQDAKLRPLSQRPGSAPSKPIKGKDFWDTFDKVGKEVLARN